MASLMENEKNRIIIDNFDEMKKHLRIDIDSFKYPILNEYQLLEEVRYSDEKDEDGFNIIYGANENGCWLIGVKELSKISKKKLKESNYYYCKDESNNIYAYYSLV